MSLILESSDLIFSETKEGGSLWRSRKSREEAGSTYPEWRPLSGKGREAQCILGWIKSGLGKSAWEQNCSWLEVDQSLVWWLRTCGLLDGPCSRRETGGCEDGTVTLCT